MSEIKTIDVLAIGNPCADLLISAARIPGWDDKCVGTDAEVMAGGTEANVACAVGRLGMRAACFGELGDDANGDFLAREFERFHVASHYMVQRRGVASATTVILVSPLGERSIVWVPMVTGIPRPDLVDAVKRSRVVYSMPYASHEQQALYEMARAAGALAAIDVEREVVNRVGSIEHLVGSCDIAFFNESGYTAAVGEEPTLGALETLRRQFDLEALVVTLGARGAMGADRQRTAMQPALPTELVDATGAGDAFNAAFLVARLRGLALAEGLRFACAAASRNVAHRGARTGLGTLDQVEEILRANTDVGATARS